MGRQIRIYQKDKRKYNLEKIDDECNDHSDSEESEQPIVEKNVRFNLTLSQQAKQSQIANNECNNRLKWKKKSFDDENDDETERNSVFTIVKTKNAMQRIKSSANA